MATHIRAGLVVDALQMALARRRPDPGVIHHSDQGGELGFKGCSQHHLDERSCDGSSASSARAAVRHVRLHRGVPQPPAPALHPEHALPNHLRTATTLPARRLKAMARTRKINVNKQPKVSRKPGQVHGHAALGGCALAELRASVRAAVHDCFDLAPARHRTIARATTRWVSGPNKRLLRSEQASAHPPTGHIISPGETAVAKARRRPTTPSQPCRPRSPDP
jgi:hypothetical protein